MRRRAEWVLLPALLLLAVGAGLGLTGFSTLRSDAAAGDSLVIHALENTSFVAEADTAYRLWVGIDAQTPGVTLHEAGGTDQFVLCGDRFECVESGDWRVIGGLEASSTERTILVDASPDRVDVASADETTDVGAVIAELEQGFAYLTGGCCGGVLGVAALLAGLLMAVAPRADEHVSRPRPAQPEAPLDVDEATDPNAWVRGDGPP